MKFEQWFNTRLTTGGLPYEVEENYDINAYNAIINVSDEYSLSIHQKHTYNHKLYLWFPMNERKKDAGLNCIYGAMIILFKMEELNEHVYLHCHAGANRSIAIKSAYYYMRTGQHYQHQKGTFMNPLLAMCGRGYLPPKAEMEKFLSLLGTKLIKQEMTGGTLEEIKIEAINNF